MVIKTKNLYLHCGACLGVELKELIMGLQEQVNEQSALITSLTDAVTNNTNEIAALVAQLQGGLPAEEAALVAAQIGEHNTRLQQAVAALQAADPTP